MDNIVINENKRIVYIYSPLSGNYEKTWKMFCPACADKEVEEC